MRSHAAVAVTCLLAVLLAGCTGNEFRASGTGIFPPYDGPVELLQQLPQPGSYDLVGVVLIRGVGFTDDDRMFEQLRELAGERGADAVIPQGKIRDDPTAEGGQERRLAGYAIRRR